MHVCGKKLLNSSNFAGQTFGRSTLSSFDAQKKKFLNLVCLAGWPLGPTTMSI